jgi:hypothetical protein
MYYQIFQGLIKTVATSAVSEVVRSAIRRYFTQGPQGQPKAEEAQYPIISIPLAIGYYYNFIEKIEDLLSGDNFTVNRHYMVPGDQVLAKLALTPEQLAKLATGELHQMSSKKIEMIEFAGQFDASALTVELIFPNNLSNQATRNCSAYLNEKTTRGSMGRSIAAGRTYGINYTDLQISPSPKIAVVDYTRPVEVIPKYYQEVKGVGGMGSDAKLWKEIEEREMEAFLYALKYMIENKSKFLYDKIYFRPYPPGGAAV